MNSFTLKVANKYMKRYSASLMIREMHIKTTVRYLLTPIRFVTIKEKLEVLAKVWRN